MNSKEWTSKEMSGAPLYKLISRCYDMERVLKTIEDSDPKKDLLKMLHHVISDLENDSGQYYFPRTFHSLNDLFAWVKNDSKR